MGTTTPVRHYAGTVPDLHVMLERRVSPDSPAMSKAFRISGRISSTPEVVTLTGTLDLLTTALETLFWGDG